MHDLLKRAAELANGMPPESFSIIHELIAEVERLRSDQDAIMAAWDKDAVEHDARIKELEAECELFVSPGSTLEAALLKAQEAWQKRGVVRI